MPLLFLLANLLLAMLLSGCGPSAAGNRDQVASAATAVDPASLQPLPLEAGEKLQVVATTNIIGDVVQQVGSDRIELITLMDTGIDPHSYLPTPADAAAIHDANVVFANGAGLEANLEDIFQSAGGGAVRIYLSQGLELRRAVHQEGGTDDEHELGAEEVDPHVWFDVENVSQWVGTVQRTLAALDPANAEVYQTNAQAYTAQLEELDAWVVAQIDTIPQANRQLVTNHVAFGYLAARYGLEQVGAVYPLSPSSEPSAQDLAALQDLIREHAVPAIFTESTVNPKLAQQVAEDTGIKLVPLYSGSLGGPGSGAETYIQLIRADIEAIANALR